MTVNVWEANPQMSVKLSAMWLSGSLAEDIVKALNREFGTQLTEAAIIGKRKRLDLPPRQNQPSRKQKCQAPKPEKAPLPPLEMNPTPLLDATPFQCRFILDGYDDHDPHVCGAQGRPWCGFHKEIVMPTSKKTLVPTVNDPRAALRA